MLSLAPFSLKINSSQLILFYDFYGQTLIDQSLYFKRSATLQPKGLIDSLKYMTIVKGY